MEWKHHLPPAGGRIGRRQALALLATAASAPLGAATFGDTNVLFIGNIYSTQMAAIFRTLSRAARKAGRIEALTPGGLQLKAHLANGEAARMIARGAWTHVVLQEQSQTASFPEDQVRATTDPAVEGFRKLCATAKARPLLFWHWAKTGGDKDNFPGDTYEAQRDRLGATFARLAREQGITLVPAGKAWDQVHRDHPDLDLYGPDGSHPSPAGSYLAACVCFAVIHGPESVAKLSAVPGVRDADAKILRDAATKALAP